MSSYAAQGPKIHYAPIRTKPHGKDSPIVYHIQVDEKTYTSTVSLTPPILTFIKGDFVKFTSNFGESAIRFVDYSPFNPPADAGQVFKVGRASEALPVVKIEGTTHFECGEVEENGKFKVWSGGADTPGGGHGGN